MIKNLKNYYINIKESSNNNEKYAIKYGYLIIKARFKKN